MLLSFNTILINTMLNHKSDVPMYNNILKYCNRFKYYIVFNLSVQFSDNSFINPPLHNRKTMTHITGLKSRTRFMSNDSKPLET